MPNENDLEKVREIQELMPFTPDYYCERCGTVLSKPVIKVFGYHVQNGTPMLSGEFRCPNYKWWEGHTVLLLEFVDCHLRVFKERKLFEELWVHNLKKARDDHLRSKPAS